MKNNENQSICAACGGACCKKMPGIVHPNDIGRVTVGKLLKMIKEGYQFDYWEGDLTGLPEHRDMTFYYLRPMTIKSAGKPVDASWGGQCIFWREGSGCNKSFDDRPRQCKALVPKKTEDGDCVWSKRYSKVEMIKAWIPHNKIIVEAIDKAYED